MVRGLSGKFSELYNIGPSSCVSVISQLMKWCPWRMLLSESM